MTLQAGSTRGGDGGMQGMRPTYALMVEPQPSKKPGLPL